MKTTVETATNLPLPTGITQDVPLQDKNWFGTGGAARYFAQPTTAAALQEVIVLSKQQQLPITVIGAGANMLIADEGVDGMVIRPAMQEISTTEQDGAMVAVTAGAGVTIAELITYCLERNIIGLEEFSGIPGTVGGSVYINIHYFEHLLSQYMVRATVVDRQGTIAVVDNNWFNFGYNYSTLHNKEHIVVDATFLFRRVTPAEAAYAHGRSVEIIRHRERRYPTTGTCGSFFRNFFDHEVTHTSNGKKMIYVAYYLDKLGVKGSLTVGGAQVSHQHANMLVNTGTATSSDLIQLARIMQEMVYEKYGVIPQPECQLIGFSNYPLL
ncbi:UDP-N-acetylmuramate dehydrogenase [Candidatus Dependentiae bacterium]|nr:UDP-N-acetylmuramate dehydrogenase [Candidatus Dependentiae bacterium]